MGGLEANRTIYNQQREFRKPVFVFPTDGTKFADDPLPPFPFCRGVSPTRGCVAWTAIRSHTFCLFLTGRHHATLSRQSVGWRNDVLR